MTNTTTTSGAADLLTLIEAYAEAFHRHGHSRYYAQTAAALQAVKDALAAGQAAAAQAVAQDDLITIRKPTTSAELLWLLKLAHLVISDVDKTLEETFAPAQPAAEASRFGSPELQTMIIARCVEKDRADSGFDSKTAAGFLSGKKVSDEALRKFVAASRCAHDARAALHVKMLLLQGELASREAEIALLKRSLLDAEAAAPQPPTAQADNKKKDPTMSFHNKPDYHIPELIEALKAHRLPHDTPSQLADSFRIGWMACCRELAQADSVQEAQEPCPTCAALARTVMLDQVSFDRKPDCYGIRQITDDEGVEEWEDIRTSPDVAREEANDMMATGRGEIYEVVPLWTTPQPSPSPQADSVQEDAALWHWLAEYLVGTRTDLDDELVACETVDDMRKLVKAAIKQGEKK